MVTLSKPYINIIQKKGGEREHPSSSVMAESRDTEEKTTVEDLPRESMVSETASVVASKQHFSFRQLHWNPKSRKKIFLHEDFCHHLENNINCCNASPRLSWPARLSREIQTCQGQFSHNIFSTFVKKGSVIPEETHLLLCWLQREHRQPDLGTAWTERFGGIIWDRRICVVKLVGCTDSPLLRNDRVAGLWISGRPEPNWQSNCESLCVYLWARAHARQ